MKKQLKLLFFVAMLVTLVVMTMVMASAADGDPYSLTKNGETEPYATAANLAAAVEAADDNDTITLLTSTTETAAVSIAKNLKIVGTAGAEITVSVTGDYWIEVAKDKTVEVTNLTAKSTDTTLKSLVSVLGKATFTSCTLTASASSNVFFTGGDGCTINAVNCTADGYRAFYVAYSKCTVNIDGGDYELSGTTNETIPVYFANTYTPTSGTAVKTSTDDTVTNIYGGKFQGVRAAVAFMKGVTCKLNVYGGEFSHTNTSQTGTAGTIRFRYDSYGELNIYGGTFKPLNHFAVCFGDTNACNSHAVANIYGGTFSKNAEKYLFGFRNVTGATLNFADIPEGGEDLTREKYDGTTYTGKAMGARLVADTASVAISVGSTCGANTIHLGDGLKIEVSGDGSLGTIPDYATIGAVHYYSYNDVLPAGNTNWKDAFFHLNVRTGVLKDGTFENITKLEDLETLAKANEATLDLWGGIYTKANVSFLTEDWRLVVSTGATLKIAEGTYTDLINDFITVEGGTLEISGGTFKPRADYAASDRLILIRSGKLSISGETCFETDWANTAMVIWVAGGEVTINCDSKDHDAAPVLADWENDYAAANNITKANFLMKNAGHAVYIKSKQATVTVQDGVFVKHVLSDGSNDNKGYLFTFNGDSTAAIATTLNIEKGYYYSNVIVYIDGKNCSGTEGSRTFYLGKVVNVKGGTFVGTANNQTVHSRSHMFMIIAPGGHQYNFSEDKSDVVVHASKYQLRVFYANANVGKDAGYAITVEGGEYNFSGNFFCNSSSYTDSTFVLKNAVLNQRYVGYDFYGPGVPLDNPNNTPANVFHFGSREEGEVKASFENVTVTATNGAIFRVYTATVTVEIISGIFIGDTIMEKNSDTSVAPNLTIKDGTFIAKKAEGYLFAYESLSANVSEDILILANSGAGYKVTTMTDAEGNTVYTVVTFDDYAPEVKYGGANYKFWVKGVAPEHTTTALKMEAGAAIYLGKDNAGASEAECGIRFKSYFDSSVAAPTGYTWLMISSDFAELGVGHLIAPADYVAQLLVQGKAFTHDNLDELKKNTPALADKEVKLDIPATTTVYNEETGIDSFAAAIYNLNSKTRAYAAVSYAIAVNDKTNEQIYVYGEYDIYENSRSAKQVAYNTSIENPSYYGKYEVFKLYYTAPVATPEQGEE